jgi:hypothetical protein
MKKLTAYKAEDGTLFESATEAISHEQLKLLSDWIEDHESWYIAHGGTDPEAIAKYLLEEFSLTRK